MIDKKLYIKLSKKSERYENYGRSGFRIATESLTPSSPDFNGSYSSPLVYIIEQLTRIAILGFVLFIAIGDFAQKLVSKDSPMMAYNVLAVDNEIIGGLFRAYYAQMPVLIVIVAILLTSLVTFRGHRFAEPAKRVQTNFLKYVVAYMALLIVGKFWGDIFTTENTMNSIAERNIRARMEFVMFVSLIVLGGLLIVRYVSKIYAAKYAIIVAISWIGFVSIFYTYFATKWFMQQFSTIEISRELLHVSDFFWKYFDYFVQLVS